MKPENAWFESVASARLGFYMMEAAIRLRDAHNAAHASHYLAEVFGPCDQEIYRDRTDLRPAYFIRTYDGCLEVTIDGPSGPGGYARFVRAFEDTRPTVVNSHALIVADELRTHILESAPGERQKILVHGHSQGSTIALVLALRLRESYPNALVRCITYGGPKCLRSHALESAYAVHVHRWMVINDPVPLVPITSDTPAIAVAQIGLAALRQYDTWQHTGSYSVIDGGTIPTARTQPDFDATQLPGALAAWLYSMAIRVQSGHSQQTYSRYLEAIASYNTERNHTSPAPPVTEPTPRQTPVVLHAAVREGTERIRTAEILQLQTPTAVPDVWRWRTARSGEVWNVFWGPYLVCSTMRRKSASSVAKWGNRWQQAIQRKPVVERSALVEAMVEYLTAAADPESGFEPQMRVSS